MGTVVEYMIFECTTSCCGCGCCYVTVMANALVDHFHSVLFQLYSYTIADGGRSIMHSTTVPIVTKVLIFSTRQKNENL